MVDLGNNAAVTGTRIAGNIQPEIKARLLLDGRSIVSGEAIKLTVPRASLSPKKAVDFMSDKPIEIELEGELLAVDGETAPFYVDRPVTV
ncbi:phage tail tube protein [Aeromonas allosaccharophila]